MVPGSRVLVPGLGATSVQGDAFFPDLLDRMGAKVHFGSQGCEVTGPMALRPVLADMSDMPDAALTLAAAACFAKGTTVLRGLGTLRVKESDRIAALRTELAKIGVCVAEAAAGDAGAVSITPPPGGVDVSAGCAPVTFDTYDDHRVAMALALIGLRRPHVTIRGAGCVSKTYPGFWSELAGLWG
jgi:3-phosphoshikimate 1-carboxyvinyltransferase